MTWIEPKTDRVAGSRTTATDLNRICNNLIEKGFTLSKSIYTESDIVTAENWLQIVNGAKTGDATVTDSTDYENLNKLEQAITYAEPIPTTRYAIGGKIFYDDGDNGAQYWFFDANGNRVEYTSISSLANATQYAIDGTPTKDRFYVMRGNTTSTIKEWGSANTYQGIVDNTIGGGKRNTALALTKPACLQDAHGGTNTIWAQINAWNNAELGGCNDWFVGNMAELEEAMNYIGINFYHWASVEAGSAEPTKAWNWVYDDDDWYKESKSRIDEYGCKFKPMRAF